MKRTFDVLIFVLVLTGLLVSGCGRRDQFPQKALAVMGDESFVGATVSLDGVALGSLEILERPPAVVIWVVSLVTGNRGPYDDDHRTTSLVFDLEGTSPGRHVVAVEYSNHEVVEKSFRYPDDMVMRNDEPDVGVVYVVFFAQDFELPSEPS